MIHSNLSVTYLLHQRKKLLQKQEWHKKEIKRLLKEKEVEQKNDAAKHA